MNNKMSFLNGSLLWFGAAISIAEILTGAMLAPLGFGVGLAVIIIGHLIGCILFYFAGLIGAKSKVSAMESVSFSFGKYGSYLFSVLNVLQLIGWTAVMIITGAKAFNLVANKTIGFSGNTYWCILIGAFIIIWIIAGLRHMDKLNVIAVGGLFILTGVLGFVVFKSESVQTINDSMSFGLGLELSIAMPISWLPLVSDYTKNTDKPAEFTALSTACYFLGSCFMYTIGLGAAIFAGNSDVVQILMNKGLGVPAMLIVVFSTVTTTFLDVYSAGESIRNIYPKWNRKLLASIICIIGTLIAIFTPIEQYQNFLYLIGSVFVPMAVILITDYFILKKQEGTKKLDVLNICLWAIGFIIYRKFLSIDTVIGSTIPVVIIVLLLCVAANFIIKKVVKKSV